MEDLYGQEEKEKQAGQGRERTESRKTGEDAEEAEESFAETLEGHYVAVDNGEVVGVSGVVFDDETETSCWLSWTYVKESQLSFMSVNYPSSWIVDCFSSLICFSGYILTGV